LIFVANGDILNSADERKRGNMRPYETVIARFKGVSHLAKALGVNHTTILKWKVRGYIPAHHMKAVMDAAKSRGVSLTLEEVVFGSEASESETDEGKGRNVHKLAA
jgi:hypothetical protein